MALAVAEQLYTPEDLLTLPEGESYELVNGRLVEKTMGARSSSVAANLVIELGIPVRAGRLGTLFVADTGFQCFPDDPRKIRKPDVAFISAERLPLDAVPGGHVLIPPDLAVEVVSPNDLYGELVEKALEYLSAGVRLVWVIHPETRSVQIWRADGSLARLGAADELDGEDVVPDFRCRVDALLPPVRG